MYNRHQFVKRGLRIQAVEDRYQRLSLLNFN